MIRWGAVLLFYGYVGLLILAGAWGMFLARLDHQYLLGLDPRSLPAETEANVLSQYRFLRATELAFGLYAFVHRHQILAGVGTGLFLTGMLAGVVARLVSLPLDGLPGPVFFFFLGAELGAGLLYLHTRQKGSHP